MNKQTNPKTPQKIHQQISIKTSQENLRIDKFLCQNFDLSFVAAQKLIRQGKIKLNFQPIKNPNIKLQHKDVVSILQNLTQRTVELNKSSKPKIGQELISHFFAWQIFDDENLLAINKPSGVAVQGGSGIKYSIDHILLQINLQHKNFCQFGANLENNPSFLDKFFAIQLSDFHLQLVHRLDKDTSGILLIAKNKKMAEFLTQQFRSKNIEKTYLAALFGIVKKESGVINIPLAKEMIGKSEKVIPSKINGKEAITYYSLIKNFANQNYSIVELKPITGRTHQLRVHCKEIGHPIINDIKYGGKKVENKNISSRMCLDAHKITIKSYKNNQDLTIINLAKPDFINFKY